MTAHAAGPMTNRGSGLNLAGSAGGDRRRGWTHLTVAGTTPQDERGMTGRPTGEELAIGRVPRQVATRAGLTAHPVALTS